MAVVPRDRSGQVLHVELLDSTTYIDFRSIATEDPDKDETEVNITIQEERGEGEGEEEEEEEGARGSGCAGEWRTRCCKCLEVIFLTTVVLLIWGVLSLPTVYHFQGERMSQNKSMNTSNGSCEEYTGSTCEVHFSLYLDCLDPVSSSTGAGNRTAFIADYEDQEAKENMAAFLLEIVSAIASPECQQEVIPLACLYYFKLCDEDGDVLLPSADQCRHIRDEVCSSEWQMALDYKPEYVPDCDTLPDESPLDQCGGGGSGVAPLGTGNCSADFLLLNNSQEVLQCVPSCEWSQYPRSMTRSTDIVIIAFASLCVLAGAIVLVLSAIQYQRMLSFPSVFVVYQTIPFMVIAILVLVGYIDKAALFCREPERGLVANIYDPSPFCLISGVVLYYGIVQHHLWWLFHTVAIFWGTLFPFSARAWQAAGRTWCIHAVLVLLGVTLPAVPVGIVFGVGGGFTITRFPPILCAGFSDTANFFAVLLPLSVVIATGVSLLVLIFWTVIKRHALSKVKKVRVNTKWSAEIKVLIVLFYYVIIGALVLTIFTVASRTLKSTYNEAIAYFGCESTGVQPQGNDTCSMEDLNQHNNPILTTVGFIVLCLYSVVNLIFVVNCQDLRKKCNCSSWCCGEEGEGRRGGGGRRRESGRFSTRGRATVQTTIRHGSTTYRSIRPESKSM